MAWDFISRTIAIRGLIVLAFVGIIYSISWSIESIHISETSLSAEERGKLQDCENLADIVSSSLEIPKAFSDSDRRAIFCSFEMNLFFKKYRSLKIYGTTDAEKQATISKILRDYRGPSKPMLLTIYERENWVTNSAGVYSRGSEKEVLSTWFE